MEIQLTELQMAAAIFIGTLPRQTETEKLTIKILRMRYIKCYSWPETAELVGYNERWIKRLEWKVIKELALAGPDIKSI